MSGEWAEMSRQAARRGEMAAIVIESGTAEGKSDDSNSYPPITAMKRGLNDGPNLPRLWSRPHRFSSQPFYAEAFDSFAFVGISLAGITVVPRCNASGLEPLLHLLHYRALPSLALLLKTAAVFTEEQHSMGLQMFRKGPKVKVQQWPLATRGDGVYSLVTLKDSVANGIALCSASVQYEACMLCLQSIAKRGAGIEAKSYPRALAAFDGVPQVQAVAATWEGKAGLGSFALGSAAPEGRTSCRVPWEAGLQRCQ
ncbi:hypothetical protein MHYP_G00301500 [Metynnis hypsauchen]